MVYTPSRHPKQAFAVVTLISAAGIAGGYLISEYIIAIALVYWIQYTAVLSYLQFRHRSKHTYNNLTETLLHPQVRFFLFEFMAFLGIATLIQYRTLHIAAIALAGWWLFSLNFYVYYDQFRIYEE